MKKLTALLLISFITITVQAQNLKPYLVGYKSSQSLDATKTQVLENLKKNGLEVVGQYEPANDDSRYVIIFTSSELKSAVSKVGGLTGFALTLRVGLTKSGSEIIVSYTNPDYWGNAYFRDDFSSVSSNYSALSIKLKKAMNATSSYDGTGFGSKAGIPAEDLHDYQYMMGMPYFDDTEELEDFDSFSEAVATIDANLKGSASNVKLVYKTVLADKKLALYGIALEGENGESDFLPTIDIGNPKHTAFLPYELLVMDDEVHMLHGRYRIALSFPDLTMGTFSQIMSTPGNIEDMLEQLVED